MGRPRALRPDCYYEREDPLPGGCTEFGDLTATSVDIGTTNFAAARVTLVVRPETDGQEWDVVLTHAAALTLKCGDPRASIETIVENLFLKMNAPPMTWFWEPDARGEPCPMYVERQVDHIGAVAAKKREHPGKAVMHAVYSALRMLEMARCKPTLCMRSGAPAEQQVADLQRASAFVPVSGHKKAGLRGMHGDQRKQKTADVAERMLDDEGQVHALAWVQRLAQHKPREDVADAYLQARRELEDAHQTRLKEKRKRLRLERKRRREHEAAERKAKKAKH